MNLGKRSQALAWISILLIGLPRSCSSLQLSHRSPFQKHQASVFGSSENPDTSLFLSSRDDNDSRDDEPTKRSTAPRILKKYPQMNRRAASSLIAILAQVISTKAFAADGAGYSDIEDDTQGMAAVTRSKLGVAGRRSFVRGAQIADKFDEKWERFSDSLRDENKCDPNTNRRLFDNGFRKDGTRIGNPVLGSLCQPVPLLDLNEVVADVVLKRAEEACAALVTQQSNTISSSLGEKMKEVENRVQPSFDRAIAQNAKATQDEAKRATFNQAMYTKMTAFSEILSSNSALRYELAWGKSLLSALLPSGGANRKDFKTSFPTLSPEEISDLSYNYDGLLDAMGVLSSTLQVLQQNGLIGNYEISIPPDDYGEVVVLAVDDDITLGAQVLLREQERKKIGGAGLSGSFVIALLRASLEKSNIGCNLDSFFLDPSSTKQEIYEPTQLLVNVSNLRRN